MTTSGLEFIESCLKWVAMSCHGLIRWENMPRGSRSFFKQYVGHSLRRGFATSAALAGASLDEIKRTTRHQSDKIVQEYLDDAALVRKNAAKKLDL